jgi:tellurite resistance protein
MSWKGTIRAIQAAERRTQRDAQRRFRELQRQAKEQAKLSVLQRARLEVETYENRIDVLLSVHKEQGEQWDWNQVLLTPPPLEPVRTYRWQTDVENRRASYVPGFFDKLFGKEKKQIAAFESEAHAAEVRDEQEFQAAWAQYQHDFVEYEDEKNLATLVLAGDHEAYVRILREFSPFAELSELGSSLNFNIRSPKVVEATVKVGGEETIPSEIKTLTSTGKVSRKAMPKARFQEIYQDYVCGCVLRVARETFALLPVEVLIVTAIADIFDSRTGRTAEQPILSVAISRETLVALNFDLLDPSDAIENFAHRGDFKASRKSGAFASIKPIGFDEIQSADAASVIIDRQVGVQTNNNAIRTAAAQGPQRPETDPGSSFIPSSFSCGVSTPTCDSPQNSVVSNRIPEPVNLLAEKWTDAAARNGLEFGFLRLTVNGLAEALGTGQKTNFTLAESKALALAAENFGYCLEPDPSHGAGNFWGDREIGIRPLPGGGVAKTSENFLRAAALLQLCFLVAAADGSVDRKETDEFRKFIENHFSFSWDERQRLLFMEALFLRNISSAKVTLSRAAKRVPPEKHLVVGQFLVNVAAADGVITPEEYKALTQIFGALELSRGMLDTLIHNLALSGNEVVIQKASGPANGEAIIQPATIPESGRLKLDMAKVAAISAETSEVIDLLTKAMADDDTPVASPARARLATARQAPPMSVSLQKSGESSILAAQNSFGHLDAKWHPIMQKLTAKDSWNRTEFEALARDYQFMPLSVFDSINEWADEALGDFILEGEDPITVRRALLKG